MHTGTRRKDLGIGRFSSLFLRVYLFQ